MTWPLDQSPIPEPEEDDLLPPEEDRAGPASPAHATGATPRRTAADEILDAVSGHQPQVQHDMRKCPKCGAEAKQLPTSIGNTTVKRRCLDNKCRHEFMVAATRVRIDVPPPPPNPMINGGPFKGNPDRGGGRPPIDPYEPIHRRVAEVIRRSTDED